MGAPAILAATGVGVYTPDAALPPGWGPGAAERLGESLGGRYRTTTFCWLETLTERPESNVMTYSRLPLLLIPPTPAEVL